MLGLELGQNALLLAPALDVEPRPPAGGLVGDHAVDDAHDLTRVRDVVLIELA